MVLLESRRYIYASVTWVKYCLEHDKSLDERGFWFFDRIFSIEQPIQSALYSIFNVF
jgi:hypothetical protein